MLDGTGVVIYLSNNKNNYKALLLHLDKLGTYHWNGGGRPGLDRPIFYDDMCLRLHAGIIHHDRRTYYQRKGYKIITFDEYMKGLVAATTDSLTVKLVKAIKDVYNST